MWKPLYLLVFVLALALAYATSQTRGSSSSTNQTSTPSQPSSTTSVPDQTQSGATGVTSSATTSGDLQLQIQNALKNEPTLANDNINVAVSEDAIDLSGTVATGKEKQTAKRIAQSYAGYLKVKDHLTVTGRGQDNTMNPSSTTNPSSNPDENKSKPPSSSQPPK